MPRQLPNLIDNNIVPLSSLCSLDAGITISIPFQDLKTSHYVCDRIYPTHIIDQSIYNEDNSVTSYKIDRKFYNEEDAIAYLKEKGYSIFKKQSENMETE